MQQIRHCATKKHLQVSYMNNPRTLYKYRKFNHESLSIFINKEIYFAKPLDFNDPFDSQINITQALTDAANKNENRIMLYNFGTVKPKDMIKDFSKQEHIIKNIGLFSLSIKNKDVLMWSHYADEHRGFCIGFNYNKLNEYINKNSAIVAIKKVDYIVGNPYDKYISTLFNDICLSDKEIKSFHNKLVVTAFTSKAKSWQYEAEYRLINKSNGYISYYPDIVTDIIFGIRMKPKDKRTVKAMLSNTEWNHISFKQAVPNGSNIQLKIRKANDDDYKDKLSV
jgi:hypothetical protein